MAHLLLFLYTNFLFCHVEIKFFILFFCQNIFFMYLLTLAAACFSLIYNIDITICSSTLMGSIWLKGCDTSLTVLIILITITILFRISKKKVFFFLRLNLLSPIHMWVFKIYISSSGNSSLMILHFSSLLGIFISTTSFEHILKTSFYTFFIRSWILMIQSVFQFQTFCSYECLYLLSDILLNPAVISLQLFKKEAKPSL